MMAFILHEGYAPGCIGRIAELHATYYSQLVGFGLYFESKVARELSAFCEAYVEGRDGLWLALVDGRVEGSIIIDGSHAQSEGAHLRWFIASDAVRGTGAGNAMLTAAIQLCRTQHYNKVYLWTFEGLNAARHLYEKNGFRLVHEQLGRQWGSQVNEQRFELQLR
jgi:GNAT superfamily N-acetyltransferase